MQFYIIHSVPKQNIKILPEYAKKVNVREGWQILSDIGHMHAVTWPGQNKLYSTSHVLTRSFCQNREAFKNFLSHYKACIFGFKNSWWKKYWEFSVYGESKLLLRIPKKRTAEQYAAQYMLDWKADKLDAMEIEVLQKIVGRQ